MKKTFFNLFMIFLFFTIFFVNVFFVIAEDCVVPIDNMHINSSTIFCDDTFDLPSGILISENNVVLDCNKAILRGIFEKSEVGITVEDVSNVTVRNCNIATFNIAILMKNATFSLIEDNALLKGRIGIRMIDSYENLIRDNVDKSTVKAISAINSMFNTVMLNNKNIDQGFCEVNSCNKQIDFNPCVNDDFYCSVNCNYSVDSDCYSSDLNSDTEKNISIDDFPIPELETVSKGENKEDEIENIIRENINKEEKKEFSLVLFLFFAILIYVIAFLVYQNHLKNKHRFK